MVPMFPDPELPPDHNLRPIRNAAFATQVFATRAEAEAFAATAPGEPTVFAHRFLKF